MNKHTYISPLGNILIEEEDGMLERVIFYDGEEIFNQTSKVIEECVQQLEEYFQGKRKTFDLPIRYEGTDFQKKVWEIVAKIPFGVTKTYKDLAVELDNLGAIRAVGTANGANPFHIIIPCHRIIGTDGSLTGYAGGIEKKKALLTLEGVLKEQTSLF